MDNDNATSRYGDTSVSALFDTQAEAQSAVSKLHQMGIPASSIRMVEGGNDSRAVADNTEREKGFWESLGDFFFPDEDRYTYAQGLSQGGYLVTVSNLTSGQYDPVVGILEEEGSIDLEEREAHWRSEGWSGYEESPYAASGSRMSSTGSGAGAVAASAGAGAASGADAWTTSSDTTTASSASGFDDRSSGMSSEDTIPVVEERLRVGKRDTSKGHVRVRAYTVEEPVSESVDLREDRVELERRPVDRAVTGAESAFQDRTIEAEAYREEAVVSKEARVVEEIGLRKTSETHRETVSDTVRRTEIEIDEDQDNPDRR